MARALECPPTAVAADAAQLRLAGWLAAGEDLAMAHDRLAAVLRADAAPGDLAALAGRMAEALMSGESGAVPQPALLALRLAAGLDGADPALWRDPFAEGAALARRRADTQAAGGFAEAALRLRQAAASTDPATDRLILREALMAAASSADAGLVRARAADLIALPGGLADLAHAYELAIGAARRAGDSDQAWNWAVAGLARLPGHRCRRLAGLRRPEDHPHGGRLSLAGGVPQGLRHGRGDVPEHAQPAPADPGDRRPGGNRLDAP